MSAGPPTQGHTVRTLALPAGQILVKMVVSVRQVVTPLIATVLKATTALDVKSTLADVDKTLAKMAGLVNLKMDAMYAIATFIGKVIDVR